MAKSLKIKWTVDDEGDRTATVICEFVECSADAAKNIAGFATYEP